MKTLVADDDATSRFILQEMLAPYGEVHSCVDGKEALQAFQRSVDQGSPYELVCLDIMMPAASGLDVLHLIREAEEAARNRKPAAKILMTTAVNDYKTVSTSFRELCDGYLVKPIDKSKLLYRLDSLGLLG